MYGRLPGQYEETHDIVHLDVSDKRILSASVRGWVKTGAAEVAGLLRGEQRHKTLDMMSDGPVVHLSLAVSTQTQRCKFLSPKGSREFES